MAKKILYKVTAYHCPRCGGVTKPDKKYCEYCERDLKIVRKDRAIEYRLMIDCDDYIYFDEILSFDLYWEKPFYLDTTYLDATNERCIRGSEVDAFRIIIPETERGIELTQNRYRGIHKIRFEHMGWDMSFETECCITDCIPEKSPLEIARIDIELNFIGKLLYGTAIPKEVLTEMRCPNCGAPITSRYGACDYCSGWSEIAW